MIGKAKCISHINASIEYANLEQKGSQELDRQNLIGSAKQFTKEMKMVHRLNHRCVNNTIRVELSPDPKDLEKITNKMWMTLPRQFVKRLGEKIGFDLNEHQWVAYKHEMAGPDNDVARPHIHLYVNRISFNGTAVPDQFIGKKAQLVAHEIAKSRGLISARDVMGKKIKKSPQKLKELMIEVAKRSKDFDDFIQRTSKEGVRVFEHKNLERQVTGLKVNYEGQEYKISDIHRSLTLNRIEKLFNNEVQKRGIRL